MGRSVAGRRQFCRCAGLGFLVVSVVSVVSVVQAFAGPTSWRVRDLNRGIQLPSKSWHTKLKAETADTKSGDSNAAPAVVVEVERTRPIQLWAVLGVAAYLSYGLKKVVPIVSAGLSAINITFSMDSSCRNEACQSTLFRVQRKAFFSHLNIEGMIQSVPQYNEIQYINNIVTYPKLDILSKGPMQHWDNDSRPIRLMKMLLGRNIWRLCPKLRLGFFAYVEGYKGFQLSFCPRVVSRAWVVSEKFEISPKNLLKRYGVAYLASSITLSLCSYTLFYELLKRGLDVEGCLSAIGISVPQSKYYGAAALAYALHKAASPIRFPPTLFLTQVLGRLIGKKVSAEDEAATRALWHKLFAPAFCIGYFHGTRARVITSWSVTTIIFFVVIAVRKLANPYRAIIDVSWSHLILLKLSSPIYLKIYHGDVVEHILSTRHLWQIYTICRRLTFVDVLHFLEICSFQDDGFEFKWFNFGIWWALMGFWGWSDRGTFMGHRVGSAIVHTIPPGRKTPGLWSLLARRHTISSLNLGISWKKDLLS